LKLVGLGLFASTAYYVGALVGLALKLPDATPSVMWPPNSILTSVLLLSRPAWWPIVLLSALPPHVALETGAGWPTPLVLSLFATNCSEALMAAGGLRWLSDAPTRFDTLRRVGIFVAVAVVAAPFLSSFLDAGAVSLLGGEAFWAVWRPRLFSNVLTALTVVPAFVMVSTTGFTWLRTATRSQRLESVVLTAAMIVVSSFLLRPPAAQDPMATVLADAAALAWFLPLLVWAALRFGPGGASVALLAASLLLIAVAVSTHGPFRGLPPALTTLGLQLFLIPMALPLLVTAALVEERRVAQQDTSRRLAFEGLLAQVAGTFVQLPSDRMRAVFGESLERIGRFLTLDWLMLFEMAGSTPNLSLVAAWTPAGAPEAPALLDPRDMPGSCIPLLAEGRMLGALAFAPGPSEPPDLLPRMQSITRVLATALFRKQSEDALRASETMKSDILASLTKGVVVLDSMGRIIAVNESWRRMASAYAPTATDVGTDYLELYRNASLSGKPWAASAAAGIEAVVLGTRRQFWIEHDVPGPDGDRTIAIRAATLNRYEGGAVVTHTDVSEQRRSQLEAQRARAELAHVARLSTVGALTASIAHQLNQPLAGILTNAQAATRLLGSDPPDLGEARASLADIVEDDRRASEVILRMRELLRRDPGSIGAVDVNALVGDVSRLLSSDAIIRNVELFLRLDARPAVVEGDRVQLQQVVLNLIVNALEAAAGGAPADRRVVVRSAVDRDAVEVAVVDRGPGFDGAEDRAFDAFYTTKTDGMGLGLFIAKSIVQAHAGVIHAANNRERGATVAFRLPLAPHGA
jgi:signal transduction histidine kinase/integral membrane sensor domain MASE1